MSRLILCLLFLLAGLMSCLLQRFMLQRPLVEKPALNYDGVKDYTDSRPACDDTLSGRIGVFLVFGQSNTTNSSSDLYASKERVYFSYGSKIYRYADPVLGIDGEGGTCWGILGDSLVSSGLFDCVVFKCVGRGATSIVDWQPGTDLYERIIQGKKELDSLGLKISGILFHQGEGDNKFRGYQFRTQNYYADFLKINNALRSDGITAPIYMSIASIGDSPPDTAVTNAQKRLIGLPGIRQGVDTETLTGRKYRYDNTHFNYLGARVVAGKWFEALKK